VTKIEHPFAKVCRAVFKEKYPDQESAIPDDSSLPVNDIPEDVITEALKRYFAGKKLIIGPRVRVRSANTAPMQKTKRTITYV
jgi:hypothetical protein